MALRGISEAAYGSAKISNLQNRISANTSCSKPQHSIGVFSGEFILKRTDFSISENQWAVPSISNMRRFFRLLFIGHLPAI
jgi:hypothetical protein